MNPEQYAKKLADFNSTEKYQKELEFLGKLVPHGYLLDYGAGIGTAARYLRSYRSGKVRRTNRVKVIEPGGYYHGDAMDLKIDNIKFDCVYFMHSIAHIEGIEKALLNVRNNLLVDGGEVVVITPNKEFIEKKKVDNFGLNDYKPDPTVLNHYYIWDLEMLFLSIDFDIVQVGKFGIERVDGEPERLFLVAKKP